MNRKLPFVHEYTDNRGRRRCYYRRGSIRIAIPPRSDWPAHYAAWKAAELAEPEFINTMPEGSVSDLIERYMASPKWAELREITRATYRSHFRGIRADHGARLVRQLTRQRLLADLRKFSTSSGRYNRRRRAWRLLLNFAVYIEMIEASPYRQIDPMKAGSGFKDWGEDHIETFRQYWPVGTKERKAFDTLLYSGQRIADAVTMMRNHVKDGEIRVVQQKTGAELWIPLHPAWKASLEACPSKGLFILENRSGRGFSTAGFGNYIRKIAAQAGVPAGYSAHGLRKAAARRLAETGCTTAEIMSITGHKTLAEVERYTRATDQKANARAAMRKSVQNRNLASISEKLASNDASD